MLIKKLTKLFVFFISSISAFIPLTLLRFTKIINNKITDFQL